MLLDRPVSEYTITFTNDPMSETSVEDIIEQMLAELPADQRLTDVFFDPNQRAAVVINGQLRHVDGAKVSLETIKRTIEGLSADEQALYERHRDLAFKLRLPDGSLIRTQLFLCETGPSLACRIQPPAPYTFAQMKLPETMLELLSERQGLILIGGPVGSRKTGLLNAFVDHMNRKMAPRHILMINDPTEFTHVNVNAKIHVREIGSSTPTYDDASIGQLRIRPDFVVLSEMRDAYTIKKALEMSNYGRLVAGTIHVETTTDLLNRITTASDSVNREELINSLVTHLKGAIVLNAIPDVNGNIVLAYEVLRSSPAMKNLLEHPEQARGELEKDPRMNTMESCLSDLFNRGIISREVALGAAPDSKRLVLN
jgi:twitching motility protein PilT